MEAARELGEVDEVEGLAAVQTLVPTDSNHSPPNTYSGNFGLGEFPLHTDLAHWARPPRFLALRCVTGSERIPTRVFDGRLLVEKFQFSNLRRLLVQSRRPMRYGKQLLTICDRVETADYRLRWDSIYLRPASETSSRLFSEVSTFLQRAQVQELLLLEPGDTLILDNWRCLHGRGMAPNASSDRKIERVYLRTLVCQ